MRDSLIIILVFAAGVIAANFSLLSPFFAESSLSLYVLWGFMALVGISIGLNDNLMTILRSASWKVLIWPLVTVTGTLTGALLASFWLSLAITDCLAVAAGFGYYSLSSIFISQYRGPELGAIALMANILREISTLAFAPLIARVFGAPSLICAGGCTTSDTTLPVILRYAGADWLVAALLHAMLLDFSVPFFVTFFCALA